jgi:hypothetical protein
VFCFFVGSRLYNRPSGSPHSAAAFSFQISAFQLSIKGAQITASPNHHPASPPFLGFHPGVPQTSFPFESSRLVARRLSPLFS